MSVETDTIQRYKSIRSQVQHRQSWMATYNDLMPELKDSIRAVFEAHGLPAHGRRFEKLAFDRNLITPAGDKLLNDLDNALSKGLSPKFVFGCQLEEDLGL